MNKEKLILWGVVAVVLVLMFKGCAYIKEISDKAYSDCVNAGIHSNETCYFYAYQ